MFFSIVIPLYNKDYSIQRCIDSVLNQSYINFQIVVVNDGSIDNSVQILKSTYKEQLESKKILLIEQKNQGVSVARNVGISNSKPSLTEYEFANFVKGASFLIQIVVIESAWFWSATLKANRISLFLPLELINRTLEFFNENLA